MTEAEKQEFKGELDRILASEAFANRSPSRELLSRRILAWLVNETVCERAEAITQEAIAFGPLKAPPSFDPTESALVRNALKRLRDRLAKYYETEGRLSRFRIVIEEGQYEPKLIATKITFAPSTALAPVGFPTDKLAVLVLPVKTTGFEDVDYFCPALTLHLMRALAASGQARVVPWDTSHWAVDLTRNPREYRSLTGADVILAGVVESCRGSGYRVTVQWIDSLTGLFDTVFEAHGGWEDSLEIADELARKLTHRLRIAYDERARMQLVMRHSPNVAACAYYLKAREASFVLTPDSVVLAFRLIEQALKLDPHFAVAHALLAELHMTVNATYSAPPSTQVPYALQAVHRSLTLAPELGDALTARGAIELAYNWDFATATKTLKIACSDPLAEAAYYWRTLLNVSLGNAAEASIEMERWAKLDPGSAGKAGVAAATFYYERQFELAIQWATRSCELNPQHLRSALFLAISYSELGRHEEAIRHAHKLYERASESPEPAFALAALHARAGKVADAKRTLETWNRRNHGAFVAPLYPAIVDSWIGEHSRALEYFQQMIDQRAEVCLYARVAPYFAPLHGRPEFNRLLSAAGLPTAS